MEPIVTTIYFLALKLQMTTWLSSCELHKFNLHAYYTRITRILHAYSQFQKLAALQNSVQLTITASSQLSFREH